MKFKILLSTALILAASTSASALGRNDRDRVSDGTGTECTKGRIEDKTQVAPDSSKEKAKETSSNSNAGSAA